MQKGKAQKSLVLRVLVFAFLVYAAVVLVDMQVNIADNRRQLEELTVQREQMRLVNKEIERELASDIDQDYIERIAREKLDFVDPDEQVFIDISGS